MTALVFIEIGYRIGETNVFTKIHRDKALLISIIIFLILIPTYRLNLPSSVTIGFNHVEMSIGSIGNALVFYCTSLMGSFAILFLACAITSSRLECFFAKFGNCTITCLVLHSIIISLVMLLTNRVGIPIWIAYTIILLLTPPLTFALHRVLMLFFPNLLGIGNK